VVPITITSKEEPGGWVGYQYGANNTFVVYPQGSNTKICISYIDITLYYTEGTATQFIIVALCTVTQFIIVAL
jgi:hypothetical protein